MGQTLSLACRRSGGAKRGGGRRDGTTGVCRSGLSPSPSLCRDAGPHRTAGRQRTGASGPPQLPAAAVATRRPRQSACAPWVDETSKPYHIETLAARVRRLCLRMASSLAAAARVGRWPDLEVPHPLLLVVPRIMCGTDILRCAMMISCFVLHIIY